MNSIGFLNNTERDVAKASSQIVPLSFTHSAAIGQTGSGKTTTYIYPNLEELL